MSQSRRPSREVALQFLYHQDGTGNASTDPQADLQKHFQHFAVPEQHRVYASSLALGTLSNLEKIDGVLQAHAANWKISRMSGIDRSLLRMAIFELLQFPELDSKIVIDEAIELGKQFGTSETPAFVNGVLDAVCRNKEQLSSCGASLTAVKMK